MAHEATILRRSMDEGGGGYDHDNGSPRRLCVHTTYLVRCSDHANEVEQLESLNGVRLKVGEMPTAGSIARHVTSFLVVGCGDEGSSRDEKYLSYHQHNPRRSFKSMYYCICSLLSFFPPETQEEIALL